MKKLMIAGLALAVLTGGALAQTTAPAAPGAPAPVAGPDAKAPSPPPVPGAEAATDDAGPGAPPPPPPGGPRGNRPPPPPPGAFRGPPPPPPSRAAHFRLERGDSALDVKCAEDEPMKACADIALQMLDRLQALPKP